MTSPSLFRDVRLDNLKNEPSLQKIDIFICSASYEGRSLNIPNALKDIEIGCVFLCSHEDIVEIGKENREKIRAFFGGSSDKIEDVALHRNEPVKTADNFIKFLDKHPSSNGGICVVDISTFTHEALLIILRVLSSPQRGYKVLCTYNPARIYSEDESDKNKKWLSRGIKSVRSVLGYAGLWVPSQESHLIVLPGYEDDRAERLISSYEPDKLSLGICRDSFSTELDEVRNVFYKKVAASFPECEKFEFSASDPFSVKETILKLASENGGRNIVVAPMNTKISTIGVAMAAMENDDIQIVYAQPEVYNVNNYSRPSDKCIYFSLSLLKSEE